MVTTYKRTLVSLFVATLLQLATVPLATQAGPLGTSPVVKNQLVNAPPLPDYAAGRILVRFGHAHPSASALTGTYGAVLGEQIGAGTYTVSVPVGQEEALVERLRADPAVEAAMLDLRVEMPALQSIEAASEEDDPSWWSPPSLSQPSSGVITETLRMSTVSGGTALPEDTLPSGSSQVYAVFDYEGLENEPLRVLVYAQSVEQSPIVVFSTTVTLTGTGTASVLVPASEYFVDLDAFPIGQYVTLIDESVSGSWKTIASAYWHVSTRPNDRWFVTDRYQWNLHNSGEEVGTLDADIDAPEAWDVTTGSENMTIAIVSSGIALNHPDLKNKIWENKDEIPANGIDDDGNGFIDDVNGYEFFQEEDNPNPADDIGWGTFASGIAAAETNNRIGMAGVSWGARLMPIKVVRLLVTQSARIPYGYISDLIQGLHYAADNDARVIFVAPTVSSAEFEKVELLRHAIEYVTAQGALVVGVVGDQGRNDGIMPALFPQVLGVGATDNNDELTEFTNVGEALRDGLVAPGKSILSTCTPHLPACVSTYPIDHHGQTAWAAAQVAGVASLVWSVNPELSPEQVRQRLQETADDLGAEGPDQMFGFGRLNAGRAVRWTNHLLHLDIPELFFLVDDQDTQVCRVIRNDATGPFSWSASKDVDWLQVTGPTGAFTPSQVEVCVLRSALTSYDTYTATLTVMSTLDTQAEQLSIPVTARYIPHKSRVFVPYLTRGSTSSR